MTDDVLDPDERGEGTALDLWREKLAFFEQQEAIESDPEKKFKLLVKIREAREKIDFLSRQTRGGRDDFLDRVAAVCRLREPEATIERCSGTGRFGEYLRITRQHGKWITTVAPLGAVEHSLSPELVQAFLDEVDANYRRTDPGIVSLLVSGGEPADESMVREAAARRVQISSFVEYQGLLDFRTYLARQTARLSADPLYPPQLYVPQRMRTVSLFGPGEGGTEDALGQVGEWLETQHARFLVILGDFGTGKTFLLHELARRMGESKDGGLVPILLQMRSLEKGRTLDALLAQHFAQEGMDGFSPAKFRYMLEQGRIALLFDGFDELALRVTYSRAAEHFDTLLQAATGAAKVVLTSRRQHFLSEAQVKTALTEKVETVAGHRLAILQTFSRPQILRFLVNSFEGDEQRAEARLDLIDRVKDLLGLSSNPRLLGFIAELPEEDLVKASVGGAITAAKLYEVLLTRWLVHEFDRVHPKGAPPGLSVDERWRAVMALALRLWQKTDRSMNVAELGDEAARVVQAVGPAAPDAEVVTFQVGSGTLLVRDDEGNFAFLHQSILEWLVAQSAAQQIAGERDPTALAAREISPLLADFFASLAGRERAVGWARGVVDSAAGGVARKNALLILERQKETMKGAQLAGQDLRGKDLSGQDFTGADLTRADMSSARLVGTVLTGACLVEAKLQDADLSEAILLGADLTGADLTGVRAFGTNLQEARIARTSFRRAKLVGATFDGDRLTKADAFGAVWGAFELDPQSSTGGPCDSVAWSPVGDLVAVASSRVIRLLEAVTGRGILTLHGHWGDVASVAFSPDGQTLASGSYDNTVGLWQVSSGQLLHSLRGHLSTVRSVAFSPDGQTLASGSSDTTISLWQVSSGQLLRSLKGYRSPVRSVAFSPDGQTLASGSSDNTISLWRVSSGQLLRSLKGHQSTVQSVAFSPDGRTLASGSSDKTIGLWRASSGVLLHFLQGHTNGVMCVAFSPDGQTLASGSSDNNIGLWQVSSRQLLRSLTGHLNSVWSVAFSLDGQTLASGSDDKTVGFWQVSSGQLLRSLQGHQNAVQSVAFSPDGKTLASGYYDNKVGLWQASSGQLLRSLQAHTNTVLSVAFSPDGQALASGSYDKTVEIWQVGSGQLSRSLRGHKNAVQAVAFSPDGKTLASGSDDSTVSLWQVSSGRLLRSLHAHRYGVLSVAFSPDGKTLASGSGDYTVGLWQISSGQFLRSLQGHKYGVWSAAFSPNGKTLATGSDDHTVGLWQVSSGQLLRSLQGHKGGVLSVAFSSDGKTLATGSYDNTVGLWQVSSGEFLSSLKGHQYSVRSVAFSPDGQTLASGSYDNTIRLWDLPTGRCLAVLLALPEGWVAFSPDGRYKFGGVPAGGFWHAANLCRFEIGELDDWIPGLRLADDASFFALPEWKPEVRQPQR